VPINKGDRVAHLDGFVGTALTAETNGSIQVRHDSGVISTWAARDAAVISRPSPSPATPAAAPERAGPTAAALPAAPRKAAAKRRPSKKSAQKKGAKKKTAPKKGASKKGTSKARKKKQDGGAKGNPQSPGIQGLAG
jgi:hypothetical protein